MHTNHTYNLMCQLVQEEKSLWRIKHNYLKDAKGCKECTALWKKMSADKEAHIQALTKLITSHLG